MDDGRVGPNHTDAALWQRVMAGEAAAFGELFDRRADAIYNFCLRRTADRTAAEDLLSATFLQAWRGRAAVQLVGDSVLPWLYGIAANLTRRHIRGVGRSRAGMARLPIPRPEPDPAEEVAGRLDDERRARRALDMLASLPQRDQDLFVLCVWQGLSYEEAAHALGVPVGTVRSRLSRARARLRSLIGEPLALTGDERAGHRTCSSEEGRWT